ncbi:MAG: hypothetical protein ACK5Q5_19585 [Planctomycetaceae bacterium]
MESLRAIFASVVCWNLLAATCWAELPRAADIVAVQQANVQRLNPLHVQVTYAYHATEAQLAWDRRGHDNNQKMLKALEEAVQAGQAQLDDVVATGPGSQLTAAFLLQELREQIKYSGRLAHYQNPIELFLQGQDYQVRESRQASTDFTPVEYPDAQITSDSLLTTYANFRIYSRSRQQTPAARVWSGPGQDGGRSSAMVTAKPYFETTSHRLPPFATLAMGNPGGGHWSCEHPIDTHYSRRLGDYRVVREDQWQGQTVIVVDADVDSGTQQSE